jgi:hypothetical protein
MKTYKKLPIEQVETIVDGKSVIADGPQMYEVIETTTTVTTDKTYRVNFINTISMLEAKKAKFIEEIDAQILENHTILAEIDKL